MRNPDLPKYKEQICSQLFGQFIGYADSKGLTKGKEYETAIKPIADCSRKVLWIDELHPKKNIVVSINSVDVTVEYGIAAKEEGQPNKTIHRMKIENMRYNISEYLMGVNLN